MSCLFGLTEIGSYRNYLEVKHVFCFMCMVNCVYLLESDDKMMTVYSLLLSKC